LLPVIVDYPARQYRSNNLLCCEHTAASCTRKNMY
jgi:hypothetical protein